jgi:hypothetical protein
VQLSDSTSTTSSTLAATPTAVKSAYDLAAAAIPKSTVTTAGDVIYATGSAAVTRLALGTAGKVLTVNAGATAPEWATAASSGVSTTGFASYNFSSSAFLGTAPRNAIFTGTHVAPSDNLRLMRLNAPYDFTVTNISFTSVSASTSITFARFGIYTRSGTTFTLVARTASDTSIFSAANTKYTRALNTAGGYPATYSLTSGSEYWVALLINASTYGTVLVSTDSNSSSSQAAVGSTVYGLDNQTDLLASFTGTAFALRPFYGEVS